MDRQDTMVSEREKHRARQRDENQTTHGRPQNQQIRGASGIALTSGLRRGTQEGGWVRPDVAEQ
jgi:hypothetical protein